MAGGFADANQLKEEAAVESAKTWLALIDQGAYAQSWEAASALFRGVVSQPQWEQAVTGARKPLGQVVSRQLRSSQYTTRLPGAPDGEYVVIQYESAFRNKQAAVETVTPMREQDGTWRVSGYYIR
jgi:hypothetical protein